MSKEILERFIVSFSDDILEAMKDSDKNNVDPLYRLGIRRLAKAFYDKLDLFDIEEDIPSLTKVDVDNWYAGR